ncbi:uncharacterized protein LOC117294995 isoform X1 [Asterias rubens]|uniref:uncharacterized protein LOC117294995 isoform X1 n=1 Tax=Asterias rubens TaxID=7604 RepID=UPI0014550495|nr:uncharacterized protein LOC117294995 isoform X1 [Asterias rubens]
MEQQQSEAQQHAQVQSNLLPGMPGAKRRGSAGRPLLSLESKREKARARVKRWRETHQYQPKATVRLSAAVSRRWVGLADELSIDNNALATLLLDLFDDDTLTSSVTLKLPSNPTPVSLSRVQTSSKDASLLTTPVYDGQRSDDEEMPSSSKGVNNKMTRDFVCVKDEPQEDEDMSLDDSSDEPLTSLKNRKSSIGLPYVTKSREEQDITKDHSHSEEGDSSSSRPGLHRELESPKGAEKTRFFIISETRMRDLAMEARPYCTTCQQPVEVDVMPNGTSAHVSWKCEQGHSSYFCCQETLQGTHLGDLQLASALVLSGNDYASVLLMFNFMNLRMIHKKTFTAYQQKFICPVIKEKASDLFAVARRKHVSTEDSYS